MLPRDVTPEQMKFQDGLVRQMSPERRVAALNQMCDGVRQLAVLGLRDRFPQASDALVRWLLVTQIYGEATARRLLGERPAT